MSNTRHRETTAEKKYDQKSVSMIHEWREWRLRSTAKKARSTLETVPFVADECSVSLRYRRAHRYCHRQTTWWKKNKPKREREKERKRQRDKETKREREKERKREREKERKREVDVRREKWLMRLKIKNGWRLGPNIKRSWRKSQQKEPKNVIVTVSPTGRRN